MTIKKYQHLNLEERELIMVGLACGHSIREIGRTIGRDHQTVRKEIQHNAPYLQKYVACKAHTKATNRAIKSRKVAALKSPEVFLYVREHLRLGWSPETIAGRLPIDHPGFSIGVETIYQYVYKNKRDKLWRFLRLRRKKRMKKGERKVRSGKIQNAVSIDLRPKRVNRRKEVGHWESDLMEGRKASEAISVTVERATRFVRLAKVPDHTAQAKLEALIRGLSGLPCLSLTLDNGKENTYHQEMSRLLDLAVYFCHAYASWEKGTVENTNGRLRVYIPKGADLTGVDDDTLALIENIYNHTPRKCLGYWTPHEKMMAYLAS